MSEGSPSRTQHRSGARHHIASLCGSLRSRSTILSTSATHLQLIRRPQQCSGARYRALAVINSVCIDYFYVYYDHVNATPDKAKFFSINSRFLFLLLPHLILGGSARQANFTGHQLHMRRVDSGPPYRLHMRRIDSGPPH
jgi:hypothetical protein